MSRVSLAVFTAVHMFKIVKNRKEKRETKRVVKERKSAQSFVKDCGDPLIKYMVNDWWKTKLILKIQIQPMEASV